MPIKITICLYFVNKCYNMCLYFVTNVWIKVKMLLWLSDKNVLCFKYFQCFQCFQYSSTRVYTSYMLVCSCWRCQLVCISSTGRWFKPLSWPVYLLCVRTWREGRWPGGTHCPLWSTRMSIPGQSSRPGVSVSPTVSDWPVVAYLGTDRSHVKFGIQIGSDWPLMAPTDLLCTIIQASGHNRSDF